MLNIEAVILSLNKKCLTRLIRRFEGTGSWQLSVKMEEREKQQGQKRKGNGITKPERLNAGRETEVKMEERLKATEYYY